MIDFPHEYSPVDILCANIITKFTSFLMNISLHLYHGAINGRIDLTLLFDDRVKEERLLDERAKKDLSL